MRRGSPLACGVMCFVSSIDRDLYLTAVSILTGVYPKVVLTVLFILTVVYILSGTSSQQHSPHFYFHVIFISAYSVVRVNIYEYVNMLGRNDLKTALITVEHCTPHGNGAPLHFTGLSYSDRLTFSNIRGRTSRQIYRLALPLLSPEMLSSLSKVSYIMRTLLICPDG